MNITEFFGRPFQDPVLVFGTVMVLILVAPALARKARLPEIVGLILAGIIVGPFALPLAMGTALGYWVFGMTIPVAILLASMFSSHTLLTFPAVTKLGLAKTRSVRNRQGT